MKNPKYTFGFQKHQNRRFRLPGIFIFFVFILSSVFAQAWRSTNGPEGGAVFCIAECKGILFAGTYGGGILKSSDSGNTWLNVNNGLTTLIVHDIVSKGDTLFAGTWGRGIYRSIDMGNNWINIFMDTVNMDLDIDGMGVVNNMLFAGTKYSQFLCSKDNGKTWVNLIETTGFPKLWFYPIEFVGINGYIFAASSQGYGVVRSNDNGINWIRVNKGLTDTGVYCLAVKDTILFAGTYKGGVFKSIDKGNSWIQMSNGLPQIANWGGAAILSIVYNISGLFAGTTEGLYRFNETSGTWHNSNIDTLPTGLFVHNMAALKNGTIFAATNTGGVYKLFPYDTIWTKANNGFHCEIVTSLAIWNNTVIASTWYGNVFLYMFKEKQWNDFLRIKEYPVNSVFIDSQNVYVGTRSRIVTTSDNGKSCVEMKDISKDSSFNVQSFARCNGHLFAGTDRKIYRMTLGDTVWKDITSLQSNDNKINANGTRLFVAGTGVFVSDDTGETWVKKINETPFKAIAANGSLIVAGHYPTGVYRSYDGGDTWFPPQQPLSYVSSLAATRNLVFAGTLGGGVFVSRDSAKTWTAINDSLPTMIVTALAVDDSLLYVGTQGYSIYMMNIDKLLSGVLNPTLSWRQVSTEVSLKMPSKNIIELEYSLTSTGNTKIDIYDMLGHSVKRLFNGQQQSGKHKVSFSIKELAFNKYIVSIKNNGKGKCISFNYIQ